MPWKLMRSPGRRWSSKGSDLLGRKCGNIHGNKWEIDGDRWIVGDRWLVRRILLYNVGPP